MKSHKIVNLNQLKKILHKTRLKVGLVHGVFDIVHVGHKRYFEEAKSWCDKLIVSITVDKFVNKGPSRPIFNERLRAEMLASIEFIDYVVLSENETAVHVINQIKPNLYIKGKDYKDLKGDLTKNIIKEKKAVEKNKGKILFTENIQFSSSSIINNFYKPQTILSEIKNLNLNASDLSKDCLKNLFKISTKKVAILGEIIIDEYIFSKEMDKPSKENIHAVNFIKKETYQGGTLAIAKNLSQFCKKIDVFSSGAFTTEEKKFIKSIDNNHKNINTYIEKSKFQTIKKTRVLDENNRKIFEIYNKKGEKKYLLNRYLKNLITKKFKKYDFVIICDFGHGFLNEDIYNLVEKNSKKVSINVQTNSDNRGFNLVTKYKKANLVCIDEPEIRLALSDRYSDFKILAKKLYKKIKLNKLIITRGNAGISVFEFKKSSKIKEISFSAFESNPIDTIGAGDAVLGIVSLMNMKDIKLEVMAFCGNVFGALATKYLGHSSYIKKNDVIKAITYSLK